jgi:hypothetical protein
LILAAVKDNPLFDGLNEVGLHTLNAVHPQLVKAPGFNP